MSEKEEKEFDLEGLQKSIWKKQIDAPEHILDALIAVHSKEMKAIIEPLLELSEDALLTQLGQLHIDSQNEWYVKPSQKAYASIDKLSKGFALAASDMAVFFQDAYISADFKDVLLNTETPAEKYPNSIPFSAMHFIKAVSKHFDESFWDENQALGQCNLSMTFLGDFSYNEQVEAQTTALMHLNELQRMTRAMPIIAQGLKDKGFVNLATIAECFARKCEVCSQDIINKTQRALDNDQELSFKAPAP